MTFDLDKLFEYCKKAIEDFSQNHQEETFYGFAIDANLLCFNSLEQLTKTLNECRSQWEKRHKYIEKWEDLTELKDNTGDWCYQGFAEMDDEVGFDLNAYNEHYNLNDEEQKNSEYGLAMDRLVEMLKCSDVFENLKTTEDFYAIRIEHNY
ncbi:MAG: hypothetical protein AB4290_10205 [Spirulina sp.]